MNSFFRRLISPPLRFSLSKIRSPSISSKLSKFMITETAEYVIPSPLVSVPALLRAGLNIYGARRIFLSSNPVVGNYLDKLACNSDYNESVLGLSIKLGLISEEEQVQWISECAKADLENMKSFREDYDNLIKSIGVFFLSLLCNQVNKMRNPEPAHELHCPMDPNEGKVNIDILEVKSIQICESKFDFEEMKKLSSKIDVVSHLLVAAIMLGMFRG